MFHIDGLKTMKEVWDNLESSFGKKDELRGHIPETEMVSLQYSNLETINQLFTKLKSLVMQSK